MLIKAFSGPVLLAFLEYPSRAVRQVKKSSEGAAEHRAGLVVCAKGLWPGSTHWSGARNPLLSSFSLGLSFLCFRSCELPSPQTVP